jgi:hypothetical protein
MTQDIIAMAREAGFKPHHNPDLYDCMVASDEAIERFAALVRADERDRATRENAYVLAEREACADIAENWNCNGAPRAGVAAQIRARGNT